MGMRLEGDHDGWKSVYRSQLGKLPKYRLVTEMDPIEISDRRNTPAADVGQVSITANDLHSQFQPIRRTDTLLGKFGPKALDYTETE